MRFILAILIIAGTPFTAVAQDLMSKRDDFMKSCGEQGTEERFCACFFDNWAPAVPESGVEGAAIALDLFAGKAPENPEDIVQAAAAMSDLQNIIFECVSGELIPLDNTPDLPAIPQTNDQEELDLLAQRIQTGQGTLDEMMRHDSLAMDLRAQARAEEEAAKAAREERALENRAALRSRYDNELTRIHRRDIEAWGVDDFAPLFKLYCQMDGGRPEECECGWPIAKRWANGRQNFVYLASRDPGDDVTEKVNLIIVQAISNTGLPGMRRDIAEACFED